MEMNNYKPGDFCVEFRENFQCEIKAGSLLNSLLEYNGNRKL